MQILTYKEPQQEFKTVDEYRNHFLCTPQMIAIKIKPLELQNLLQEIEDVLMTATEGKDWMFGVQTRMSLYELYKGLGGTKFK